MQHGRYFQRFADRAQPRPRLGRRFRQEQPGLCTCYGGTAGFNYQDILFDQFLSQRNMAIILFNLGVIAPYYSGNSLNVSFLNSVEQGVERASKSGEDCLR